MEALSLEGPGPSCFRFLGEFRFQRRFAPCHLPLLGKTQEVLALLALNANKDVRRSTLSSLIWTDCSDQRSRANLNTALWRINRALKAAADEDIRLHVSGHSVKLSISPRTFVDVTALEASVREAAELWKDGERVTLAQSVRQTLLDVLAEDCQAFLDGSSSHWVLIERERVFNLQIRGLSFLMQDLAERGYIEEALEYGRRILRMDPMRECVQRQVMWLYVLNGHQANAIRQYLECACILQRELGVTPMSETRALYEFLVARNPSRTDAAVEASAGGEMTAKDGALAASACSDEAVGQQDQFGEELTRLRSLAARLYNHRQSVFSALARGGVG
jgi:DNA-binding SARP family transcriptional activator